MAKKIILLADGTGNGRLVQVSNICRLSQALDMSDKDQLVYYIPGVGTSGFYPWQLFDGATGWGVPSNILALYRFLSWNWEPGAAVYMFGFSRGAFTIRMLIDLIRQQGLLPTEMQFPGESVPRRVKHQEMIAHSKMAWRQYVKKLPAYDWAPRWMPRGLLYMGYRALRWSVLKVLSLGTWPSYNHEYLERAIKDQGRDGENIGIDFVGLFDTVEAFGVPVEEMRPSIDFVVFPILFGQDHSVWKNVACLRQALSLDDERRTFHPIRVALQPGETIDPRSPRPRIQEVWFAGVHSDVGGGYPDDMVAHCPLLWMVDEAGQAADPEHALVFNEEAVDAFRKTASAFAELHDSRAGTAVLYRYSPREVTSRDPKGNDYCWPTVHHTVVERLVDGPGDYAPLALGELKPGQAKGPESGVHVVMPDGSIVQPKAGDGFTIVRPAYGAGAGGSLVSKKAAPEEVIELEAETPVGALRLIAGTAVRESPDAAHAQKRIEDARRAMSKLNPLIPEQMERAKDYVLLNEIGYFVFLAFFVFVAALPLLDGTIQDMERGLSDWLPLSEHGALGGAVYRLWTGTQNLLRGFGNTILMVTPSYLYPYVDAALRHFLLTAALLAIYVFVLRYPADIFQDETRYHARRAWNIADRPQPVLLDDVRSESRKPGPWNSLRAKIPAPLVARWPGIFARALRKSGAIRGFSEATRAYVLPVGYGLVFLALPLSIAVLRMGFNYQEGSGRVCTPTAGLQWDKYTPRDGYDEPRTVFVTSAPCWASGWGVERGAAYRLTIKVDPEKDGPWLDQTMLTDPYGFKGAGWRYALGLPLRRWLFTDWFRPVARIGAHGDVAWPLVPTDGGDALSPSWERCTRLPFDYSLTPQHKTFCDKNPTAKSCPRGETLWIEDALQADEIKNAKGLWKERVFPRQDKSTCTSAFPRDQFVSDFVAGATGELFLYVNDAIFLKLNPRNQWFYNNNNGTGVVTLERLPSRGLATQAASSGE